MSNNSIQCPGCNSNDSKSIYILSDTRYIGIEASFSIRQCRICRLKFIQPLPTDLQIQQLFENLYNQNKPFIPELAFYFADLKSAKQHKAILAEFQFYLDLLNQTHLPGELLDLGCGEALFLNMAKNSGWQISGMDNSPSAVSRAKEKYNIEINLGTIDSVNYSENSFDAITLLDFMEHLSHPVEILNKIYYWLKPGGILFITTPNQASLLAFLAHLLYKCSFGMISSPLYRIYMLPHFLYFTPATLSSMIEKAGFKIILLEKSNTDLQRLSLNPLMKIGLKIIFIISRIIAMENRLILLAKKI